MTLENFNVFVGSDTGFLKGANLNSKCMITKSFYTKIKSSGNNSIASLSWLEESKEKEILVGYSNRILRVFNCTDACFTWSDTVEFGKGQLVSAFNKNGKMIAAISTGEVGVIGNNTTVNTLPKSNIDKHMKAPTLCCARSSPHSNAHFATGGCENDVAIWDINNLDSKIPIFRAKNVANDELDLRIPIWVSDLQYLTQSDLIASISRHSYVRLYDHKSKRKPVVSFKYEDQPLTALSVNPTCDKQIMVGTNHGRMALFDLRRSTTSGAAASTPVAVYKGISGGIKDVFIHDSLPLVFSVSIDRHLRVHDLYKKTLIYKEFLKSKLTCLLTVKELKAADFKLEPEIKSKSVQKLKNFKRKNDRSSKNPKIKKEILEN